MSNLHVFKNSSSLSSCDYDDENKTLVLCFQNGGTHHFKNVPKEHYEGIKISKSPGSYFHQHVRTKYKSIKA